MERILSVLKHELHVSNNHEKEAGGPLHTLSRNVLYSRWERYELPRWLSTKVKNPPAKAGNAGDTGPIPGLGRSSGEGNGNPLWYSCLGNPWTEEPSTLQAMESQRSRQDWAQNWYMANSTEQGHKGPSQRPGWPRNPEQGRKSVWEKGTGFPYLPGAYHGARKDTSSYFNDVVKSSRDKKTVGVRWE